ncbi:MAG: DUF3313 domain-containing protein [Thermodesulfovibrionia bacterium]|nr:DUF3313 domain-containing protein [Thermodesulfovibrionia bacterium]
MKIERIATATIICCLVMVMGCSKGVYPEFFHGRYPNFKPGPEGGADLIYVNKKADLKRYKMIMLNVEFYYGSAAQYMAIHPDVTSDLSKALKAAFADALGNAYPLVDKPRHDVLRIRIAITGMVPLIPDSGTHAGMAVKDRPGKFASVGGASMQADILDSWTGERVGAVIDTKGGHKLTAVEVKDEWAHTKAAFKFWAERLRTWLDQTHDRK